MKGLARAAALAAALILSACAVEVPPVTPPPAPLPTPQPAPPVVVPPPPASVGATARAVGVTLAQPHIIDPAQAARALAAFKSSCPALMRRTDVSELTTGADWSALCAQAVTLDPAYAPGFFYYNFDWVQVGDGAAFATGYYEPEIEGARTPQPGYAPIYRTPPDLIRCTRPDGGTGRGRMDQTGVCVPYYSRPEIDDGALNGRGLELAWAKDPLELFVLEIQGSGQVRMADGSVMRIGYDGQNGREYVAIGRLLRDRGIFQPGQGNMQAIKDWIRAHPDEGRALMRENLSYVFFKELTGPGPLGALGMAVTPRGSVAADPKYVPLGAPVFLTVDRPEASGLWVAQDTGGAIKGANRFDTFWGAGPDAVATAGGMSASGSALLLLPKGVAARALAQP